MADRSDRRSSMGSSCDEPPNSRLFIIGSKLLTEDDYRQAFNEYGHIEELWTVKDRQTGENKGVTYIKYAKTSEAARALEAMNDKAIGGINRSIKVMVAASRDQGSKRDANEEEKIQRLFVIVPKTMTDTELYNNFKMYGDIDYATIIRDRDTKESKGFAYVKYFKFSHAAAAYEQCDRKYRAVFAEPRKPNNAKHDDKFPIFHEPTMKSNTNSLPLPPDIQNCNGYTKLIAVVSPQVNQDQLWKLFDIVPGLDYCHLRMEGRPRPVRGVASIVYTNPQWAAYAKEKLHGLEYPPGSRIIVKPDLDGLSNLGNGKRPMSIDRNKQSEILQIAETISQASTLLQAAGLSPDFLQTKLGLGSGQNDSEWACNVDLPDLKPLASVDAETKARCFIVCTPNPPPNTVLKEIFCRFGDLIDVYMLNNRNCGYARYASKESAKRAMTTLHGAEIGDIRIKVLEAEERPDYNRKRQRLDERP